MFPGSARIDHGTVLVLASPRRLAARICVLLLAFGLVSCSKDDPFGHLETARVQEVLDGDTIVLEDGRHVRYIGIDTPEVGEPGADSATHFNQSLVAGQVIRLEHGRERRDRYGRTLAWVFVNDRMVNLEILKRGWAWCFFYPDNMKYADQMVLAVRLALDNSRGLWRNPQPDPITGYVGSINSFRFHGPECESVAQIKSENRIVFPQRDSAIYIGYAPCRNCTP